MTAARGIIREEFHSPHYSKTGGPFRMVQQFWVNLPPKTVRRVPGITDADISGTSPLRVDEPGSSRANFAVFVDRHARSRPSPY